MEHFISFFNQHWILSSLLVVMLLALLVNEYFIMASGSDNLSTAEVLQLMNHKDAVVVDIRNPHAFSDGHIIGSLNIPLDTFDKKAGLLEKFKDRNLIVVCAAGQSNQKVMVDLKKKGFQALGLSGGIAAWKNAGLPLSKH